jgi:hypothetical protein
MARIRTIKPEFFTSEDIVSLTPYARLLYIAIWCEADREGRLNWKPNTLKMRYFPADNMDIQSHCKELIESGLIVIYGNGLAYIPKFSDHQHINPRESESKITPPELTRELRVVDASVTRREEGKGKESIYNASLFEQFWKTYPNKKGKSQALKSFIKLKVDDPLFTEIMLGLEVAIKSSDWTRNNGQFIPHPATWLNGERWKDEYSVGLNLEPEIPEWKRGML